MTGRIRIEDWREADRLFAELLELPPESRAQRLRELSTGEGVSEALRRLLAGSETPSPLDSPPGLQAAEAVEEGQLAGMRLGPWLLEEEIGRGGMAVVYRASREEADFRHTAAVKLLPRGMTGRERFLQEQAVLARLQHPHIARFYDGGVAEDGTPWIAMQLVEGARLDVHARDLDLREKVRLLLPVIDAVAHAHRHLVIHRDLKPGNVLVDAHGQPQLLDFGIAKLLSEEADGQSTRLLTPRFAAPEQHAGEAVSTATDVYGLGAILHALLTGQSPRDAQGRPQDVLSRCPIDRDLRNIVAKALRDEPGARYPSAEALGADLLRWLEGRPVQATPDSRGYRVRKWVSRHRVGAAASLAVVAVIGVAVGAVLVQSRQTRLHAETVEAQNAILSEIIASPQVALRGRSARVVDVLEDVAARIGERLPEPSLARAALYAQVARSLDQLENEALALDYWDRALDDLRRSGGPAVTELRYLEGRVSALLGSGQIEEALAVNAAAEQQARESLPADHPRQALVVAERLQILPRAAPQQIPDQLKLADARAAEVVWTRSVREQFDCAVLNARNAVGRFAEVIAGAPDYLSEPEPARSPDRLCVLQALLVAQTRSGDLQAAEQTSRTAVALAVSWLGEHEVTTFQLRNGLGNVLQEQGKIEEAIAIQTALIEARDRIPGLDEAERLMPVSSLGVVLLEAGRYEEARPLIEESLEARQRLLGPGHVHSLIDAANLSELLIWIDQPEEALALVTRTEQLAGESMGEGHPITQAIRGIRGGALVGLDRAAEAHALLDGLDERMAKVFGEDDVNVVNVRLWRAAALVDLGRQQEARPLVQSGVEWRRRHFGAEHPKTRAAEALQATLSPPSPAP
ncbi:serine/threonine-protein kinase [Pseudomarimonas salicorniae]|uniref:Serine/threonine-protein kinase n=1 Tax=Pseudomarimonas salicorniae TaxID=2933270 RepID=A0ABT0GEU6_9GAMM|nr:serine/threonine-protein kinase [Lysobacter sp. CAU 1642]MCK7593065.1 serine/threonine-protein kinase [Lysobacter sp. CAU 1642]